MVLSIKHLQLSANVLKRTELISQNIRHEFKNYPRTCDFSLSQSGESRQVSDTAQLALIIRMVFSDNSLEQKLLTILLQKGKKEG